MNKIQAFSLNFKNLIVVLSVPIDVKNEIFRLKYF